MARPTTKQDLIAAADGQFEKLWKLIDSMPAEMQAASFAFEDRDKNLRDVLTHLHEWHLMVQRWHAEGTLRGGMPAVPGEGYTWKTLPALNAKIWERYQGVTLDEAKRMLRESHAMVMALVESHTNDELFARGVYKWTKTTTLGAYFISATASHYDWAMKKLKQHARMRQDLENTRVCFSRKFLLFL
ncbi:MAG: ClbS/DfsB family four-helix bundle protein [Rikenellaceae bacterium]|nr:ClbS/DfsB family four-helix bundle protein [Rikenellaceae bacterium]MCL2691904.1 ClbS/DfsB family four-helix bundle protein [Rikenellaceae bacterium]